MQHWLWPVLVILVLSTPAHASSAPELDVTVAMHGDTIVVDVQMSVDVNVATAWGVLTDYEHMTHFVSDLRLSEVVSRYDDVSVVHQIGETRIGLFRFSYDTVRKVRLSPMTEIESTLVAGDFKSYRFSTRLYPTTSGCIVVNHGEYVPTRWVPPILGPAFIEQGTRTQYEQLRAEMLRRLAERRHASVGR